MQAQTPDERRQYARRPCEAPATLSNPTPDPRRREDPHDTRQVSGVNLSGHRGVGFVSDRPLRPGTYHRIRLPDQPHAAGPEVRVTHCSACEQGYAVGGELV